VTVRAKTQERAVDEMNAFIGGHDLVQSLELRFVIGNLSHG
jgi:hypothetical protein